MTLTPAPGATLPCGHPVALFETTTGGITALVIRPSTFAPGACWCSRGCGWVTLTDEEYETIRRTYVEAP